MPDTIALVREYARLRARQGKHKTEMDAAKELADEIERQLLDEFAQSGVDQMRVEEGTVYLHRMTFAHAAEGHDRTDVVEAMKQVGLEHMVSEGYNANTLSAYVRDLIKAEQPLPPALDEVVQTTDKFSLRVRRG